MWKAWRRWGMISRVLTKMRATVQARRMLYKAVAKNMKLYGIKSWVVIEVMLKLLEGFYHGATWWITEWWIVVRRSESRSTNQWLMRWNKWGCGWSRNKYRAERLPLLCKCPAGQYMSCAISRNGCWGLAGWWGSGTRTWDVKNNNPEQSVV